MFRKLRDLLSAEHGSSNKSSATAPRRGLLSMELLEDRLVPAAMTYVVSNLNDSASAVANDGSLRGAILAANANLDSAADTIKFADGLTGTITLTAGELSITDSVKIVGAGSSSIGISGNNASRIFAIDGAGTLDVLLSGMTLAYGKSAADGGAIRNADENLTIKDAIIAGNKAVNGAGIYQAAGGSLTIENSTVSGNSASGKGGAIAVSDADSLTIRTSTIADNAALYGGGLDIANTNLLIQSSTFSGNYASSTVSRGGGAIRFSGSAADFDATIENSTISGNGANNSGGGIYIDNGSSVELTIRSSTITNNISDLDESGSGAGGGIVRRGGTVAMVSSIVAQNTDNSDVADDISNSEASSFTVNHSLVGDKTGAAFTGENNITGTAEMPVDARLAPLANNGGPTQTHALLSGSAAINAGSTSSSLGTDQRGSGHARTVGERMDMGAFEVQSSDATQGDEAFIRQLYLEVLGRTVKDDELSGLLEFIAAGSTRQEVAEAIWDSSEHRGMQVDSYYQIYLGRSADEAGRSGWIAMLQNGMTEEDVISSFVGSQEFRDKQENDEAYIKALYQLVLGRQPSESELSSWTAFAGKNSAESIAAGFVRSNESHSRFAESYYGQLLNRSATSSERTQLAAALDSGSINLRTMAISILVNDEFLS